MRSDKVYLTVTDLINSGDFHTILTDDAKNFNVHDWEKRVAADDDSDGEFLPEPPPPIIRAVVSAEDVRAVLDKIADSDVFVADYGQTEGFSDDDVKEMIKRLSACDDLYRADSGECDLDDTVSVWITNKDFSVNGKDLFGCLLSIKIDFVYGDPVAIVSLHGRAK